MRNLNKNFHPLKMAAIILEKSARQPLLVFLLLSMIAAGAAAWVFYGFQSRNDFADRKSDNGENLFNETKLQKYKDVFIIIKQREIGYGQAASATFPDVFKPARKPDQR